MWWRSKLVAMTMALVATSCGDDESAAPGWQSAVDLGTYVGKATDPADASVAIVAGVDNVVVFVAGGGASLSTATGWFEGPRAREGATVITNAIGRTLHLERDRTADERADTVLGRIEGGPVEVTFTLVRSTPTTPDGLFEANEPEEGRTGVVLTEGRAQGAFVRAGTRTVLPVQITDTTVTADTLEVVVEGRDVEVKRVYAP